ncbi:hypothetical protein ACFV9P_19875 [Streptomyces sp. NPDC059892]
MSSSRRLLASASSVAGWVPGGFGVGESGGEGVPAGFGEDLLGQLRHPRA